MGSIRSISRRWPGLLWLLAAASGAGADTVTLQPSRDNTLYEDSQGSQSNGAGAFLFVGRTGQSANSVRRALLAFDLSAVPAGSTVTSVTLTLNMSRAPSAAGQTVQVHRVLAEWGEGTSDAGGQEGGGATSTAGDATWRHAFFSGTPWSSAGGDYAATASASAAVGGTGSYTWGSTAGLVADVQGWVDAGSTSFGWILIGNESTTRTAKRFDSRQHPTASSRPLLTVVYQPPNRPPAVAQAPADLDLVAGAASASVDLAGAFTDPDGDPLSYGAVSSNPSVAAAAVTGSTLSVTPLAAGQAQVTATATDPDGASASLAFDVAVAAANASPIIAAALPDLSLVAGTGATSIDLTPVFTDPDGDPLSYGAVSSNPSVAAAAVSGSTLTMTPVATGQADVTATATDPDGASASDRFRVTVSPAPLPGDFDGSGAVDFDDFFRFADHFGRTSTDPGWDPAFDLAVNGAVDFDDFFRFADHFGRTSP